MKLRVVALSVLAACASLSAHAESNVVTTGSATARLDFTITIPRVLFLQVGTGTPFTTVGTIDNVTFTPTTAQIVSGGSVAAATNGTVTVRVAGNNGTLSLSAAAAGQLNNGGTQNIPWTEIGVTAATPTTPAAGFTAASITHPVLTAAGTSSTTTLTATGTLRQESNWTFAYNNTGNYNPGTYGGTGGTNNGRLTYTLAMP